MFLRKQSLPTPWMEEKGNFSKSKETHYVFINHALFRHTLILFLFLSLWLLLLCFFFNNSSNETTTTTTTSTTTSPPSICNGDLSVYVYQLPPDFNQGLLNDCHHLNIYTDMCPHVANSGLGQRLSSSSFSSTWFATHQFLAEMIFHARLLNHPCRTLDPSQANLFFVPFYGGLHVSSKFREANFTARDELAVRLVDYLQSQPWWQRFQGHDHVLTLGRTAWDFMRTNSGPDFGANCLLNLPPVRNMSVLTVERQPWDGSNQHGIPYPSYFHPYTAEEMLTWQTKMIQSKRRYLFSFIGAPRKGVEKANIRDELIKQCNESTRCNLMKCQSGGSKCHDPMEVVSAMTQSQFCLQAPGDSFTRRSTFDSVLAGCIPVFFSRHTAYTQYSWFFPDNPDLYSVYMDEKEIVNGSTNEIEKRLSRISNEQMERMRRTIVDVIPRVTYFHPNASDVGYGDAVDVALSALGKHVRFKLGLADSVR